MVLYLYRQTRRDYKVKSIDIKSELMDTSGSGKSSPFERVDLSLYQFLSSLSKFKYYSDSTSGWNYSRLLVMTDHISDLTEQSFPEIRRNDRSLIETIWTLKCDKLHVFNMVDEVGKKSLLIEYYLCMQQNFRKQNSFWMCKLLIKIKCCKHNFEKNPFIG